MAMLTGPAFAVRFLTRIPLNIPLPWNDDSMRKSLPFFPVAGAMIGLIASLPWLLGRWWPETTMAAASVTMLVLLTGGLHLDGLGDCCDGLLSGRPLEHIREIMKEGGAGPFAVAGIVLLLLMKIAVLTAIGPGKAVAALVSAVAVARWAVLVAMFAYPAAGSGLGEAFKRSISAYSLLAATVFMLLLLPAAGHAAWLLLLPASLLSVLLLGRPMARILGGLTGDCYGALIELTELLALTVLSFM